MHAVMTNDALVCLDNICHAHSMFRENGQKASNNGLLDNILILLPCT